MSFSYILKEGFSGFLRAKLSVAGSVLTVAIALTLVGIFYVISTNTSRLLENIRSKVEMEAFLEEPVSPARISSIGEELSGIEGVDSVAFISKEEAAAIFKKEFGEDIKSVLDFNPLPPSFKIFLKDDYRTPERAAELRERVRSTKGVEDVVYRKEMLEFIQKQARTLYQIGLVLGILLGISAVFLISNTIRLTIEAKRKMVQAMKLVGATRTFVRAPFLIEGVMQGLIGGLLASGAVYYLVNVASGMVSGELAEFLKVDVTLYPMIVAAGILLGFLGSAISVSRFIGETVG